MHSHTKASPGSTVLNLIKSHPSQHIHIKLLHLPNVLGLIRALPVLLRSSPLISSTWKRLHCIHSSPKLLRSSELESPYRALLKSSPKTRTRRSLIGDVEVEGLQELFMYYGDSRCQLYSSGSEGGIDLGVGFIRVSLIVALRLVCFP